MIVWAGTMPPAPGQRIYGVFLQVVWLVMGKGCKTMLERAVAASSEGRRGFVVRTMQETIEYLRKLKDQMFFVEIPRSS